MFLVSMSLRGWLVAAFIASILVIMPFLITSAIADSLSDPLKTIVLITGNFIIAPALVSFLYYRSTFKNGKGSIIFWLYCGIYALLFTLGVSRLLTQGPTIDSVAGTIATGIVTILMVTFAFKTRAKLNALVSDYEETERDDKVRQQAEAILLAEQMKSEQSA